MRPRRAASTGDNSRLMATVPASPVPPTPPPSSSASSPPSAASRKRMRRQCSHPDCRKVDAGGGFCVAHGGGKKCSFPGCTKGYQTGGFCRKHGGGARCQVIGCGKVDAGRGLCRAHGGGKRCQIAGCPKADVGGGFCTTHGGGRRCSEPGCTKIDQGGGRCRAHGGARRCRRRGCQQPARGVTGFCSEHGGARVCSVLSCRRLVRSPNDTGTMCATCSAGQKQRGVGHTQVEHEHSSNSDQSSDSPRDSAALTPERQNAHVLASFRPPPPHPANSRCDGSRVAGCLNNGCARSYGGDCNCAATCSCNAPTSPCTSRTVPVLTSSNTIPAVASPASQTQSPNASEFASMPHASSPRATMVPRVVLRIRPRSSLISIQTIVAMLAAMSGIRSVHVVTDSSTLPRSDGCASKSETTVPDSGSEPTPSSWLVVVRGDESLDTESFPAVVQSLQLAEIVVVEQTSTAWTRKEVVLRVPDMMCPANCGTSILNAVRVVDRVEAARLRFEHRQVVVRGDMSVDALCAAVMDIGFDSKVDAETLLPRRFRFRVDDLSDVGLNGVKLEETLIAVEGVENLVLLTDRIEVLVVAMLQDSTPLVEAARRAGFDMLELAEEAWRIPVEAVPPPPGSSNHANAATTAYPETHKCDMRICPQFGCPTYMTTVAHTAALAVGWAVPGCGMASGGECTCGDSCKFVGCPKHDPVS
ncbi:unnamed protein product [Hyaloperonospora brassicae]|uniref:WRKY19-like zinc finger domain-containing protein n=1 Tax=Hyaloperonospora brassicae TaxID=162125 RepID=A0AAV0T5G3_HYABA|nr:unnamed protein product [Hyaloperonospora brassicae]